MDFSSLVLFQKEEGSNNILKEVASYEILKDSPYLKKFYLMNDKVYIYFDSGVDVSDDEYSKIYEDFNEDVFMIKGYKIEFDEDGYNPTWIVNFNYVNDYVKMQDKLNEVLELIEHEMNNIMKNFE